ncbi:MAG: M48 family metallopeptidase [Myxococcales bacterium]|nr:M48 family metallopeptidase [Myxococcales bacterium]
MFDFQTYVDHKKNPESKRDAQGFGEYAFSGDVRVLKSLSYARPVRVAAEASVRAFKAWYRSDILGKAIKVSPRQFPRLYDAVRHCADQLSIATPTVYITQDFSSINAGTFGTETDSFIMVNSATVDRLSESELLFVLGHECGHIQNSHVTYSTALHFLTNMAGQFVRWVVTPARVALMGWSRRAEITCDRAGLVCSRDLDSATSALVKLAVGSQSLVDQVDLEDYLAQVEQIREGYGRVSEYFLSHPYLPKRVKALREFAESDYYQHHLGRRGGVPLAEVDKRVDEIVSVL